MKTVQNTKKLSLFLWLLTLIPPLIVLTTEMNKTVLVGYMRIVDFIDLLVMAPFFLVMTLAIHSVIYSEKPTNRDAWLSLAFIGILLYGHAMHMTANSINTYSTEIKDYRSILPEDTYALIYFLDEHLGHWLLYAGLFGLLGLWTWSCNISISNWSSLLVSGFVFGISYGVVLIESSQVWMALLIVLLLIGSSFLAARKQSQHFLSLVKSNPMAQFTFMTAIGILVGMSIYFMATGGFIEPSQYGL
jgi:hypothetical protein